MRAYGPALLLSLELVMVFEPPVGDVDPSRKPDVLLSEAVFDELAQRRGATGLSGPTRVEADRHHLRITGVAFAPELVQRSLADVEEVGRPTEALRQDVAAVVIDHRVRHDEMALSLHFGEVREVVVVGVGVVDEAAFLDE